MNVAPPEEQESSQQGMYRSQCSFEGNGDVSLPDGTSLCQLTTLHLRPLPFWFCTYGLLRDPGCSIAEAGTSEPLRVTRERRWPLPQFVITRGNERVCTITRRSALRNMYTLSFAQGSTWRFHMPLFTPHFQGTCNTGGIVRVREWTKRDWYILVEAHPHDSLLLCALAFIHRERLRFA